MNKISNIVTTECRCDHYSLCFSAGAGCTTKSSMASCGTAIEVKELATKWPCPAVRSGHCEIPDYLVLVKRGVPCGEENKCFLIEFFKGLIPPQDFVSTGKLPETYKRPRAKKSNILRILKEVGMR